MLGTTNNGRAGSINPPGTDDHHTTLRCNNWSDLITGMSNAGIQPRFQTLRGGKSIEAKTDYYKFIITLRNGENNEPVVDVSYVRTRHGGVIKNLWFDFTHSKLLRHRLGHSSPDDRAAEIRQKVTDQIMPATAAASQASVIAGNESMTVDSTAAVIPTMSATTGVVDQASVIAGNEPVTVDNTTAIIPALPTGIVYQQRSGEDRVYYDTLKINNLHFEPEQFLTQFIADMQEKTREGGFIGGATFCMAMATCNPATNRPELTIASMGDSELALVIHRPDAAPLVYRLNELHPANLPRIKEQVKQQIKQKGGKIDGRRVYDVEGRGVAVGSALGDHAFPVAQTADIINCTVLLKQINNDLKKRGQPDLWTLMAAGRVVIAAASDGISEESGLHYDGVATFQKNPWKKDAWKLVPPQKHELYDRQKKTTNYFNTIMPVLFQGAKPEKELILSNTWSDDCSLVWFNLQNAVNAGSGEQRKMHVMAVLDGHAVREEKNKNLKKQLVVDVVRNELETRLKKALVAPAIMNSSMQSR